MTGRRDIGEEKNGRERRRGDSGQGEEEGKCGTESEGMGGVRRRMGGKEDEKGVDVGTDECRGADEIEDGRV